MKEIIFLLLLAISANAQHIEYNATFTYVDAHTTHYFNFDENGNLLVEQNYTKSYLEAEGAYALKKNNYNKEGQPIYWQSERVNSSRSTLQGLYVELKYMDTTVEEMYKIHDDTLTRRRVIEFQNSKIAKITDFDTVYDYDNYKFVLDEVDTTRYVFNWIDENNCFITRCCPADQKVEIAITVDSLKVTDYYKGKKSREFALIYDDNQQIIEFFEVETSLSLLEDTRWRFLYDDNGWLKEVVNLSENDPNTDAISIGTFKVNFPIKLNQLQQNKANYSMLKAILPTLEYYDFLIPKKMY